MQLISFRFADQPRLNSIIQIMDLETELRAIELLPNSEFYDSVSFGKIHLRSKRLFYQMV